MRVSLLTLIVTCNILPHMVTGTHRFHNYKLFDVGVEGCRTESLGRPGTPSHCGQLCSLQGDCYAFLPVQEGCMICDASVTGLSFMKEKFWFKRTVEHFDLPYDETTMYAFEVLPLQVGLYPGMMLYWSSTGLREVIHAGGTIDYEFDFMGAADTDTILLHANPRWNYGHLALNAYVNYAWGLQVLVNMSPFPFAVGKKANVHILVTNSGYMIYIDQEFCCQFEHRVPLTEAYRIRVNGYQHVHELSW